MADVPSLLEQAKKHREEARTLITNPEASAEDNDKAAGLLKLAEGLAGKANSIVNIEKLREQETQLLKDHEDRQTQDPEDDPKIFLPQGSEYKSLHAFVKNVVKNQGVRKSVGRMRWHDDTGKDAGGNESKTLTEAVGASGGFLVPPEFQATMLQIMAQRSIIRPRATIVRMRRRQIDMPVLDQTATTSGVPHWFGGVSAVWTEEAGAKTHAQPAFRKLQMVAHKLALITRISDELLDDAVISLTDFLMGEMGFPGAIAWQEEHAFLRGNGAGQPLGILNSAAAITVPRVDQDNITYDDLVAMLEAFLPSGRGLWLASQSTMSNLLTMVGGEAGNRFLVWGPGPLGQTAIGNVPATLMGYPIIFTEHLPRISTTSVGDLILVDLNYYLIGDRQATTLASTIYESFTDDLTTYRAVHRVDGKPWLSAPLTYEDGTTQVSPFVLLGAKTTS